MVNNVKSVQPGHKIARPDLVRAAGLASAGRLDEAVRLVQAALNVDPNDADALSMMGQIALQRRSPGDASGFFRRAVANAPRNVEHHLGLGVAFMMLDRFEAGLESLRRAVSLKPSHAGAQYNLGLALLRTGDFADAAQAFSKTIRKDPSNPFANMNLGLALVQGGNFPKGLRHLRRATALAPRSRDARINLGKALVTAGHYEDAVAELNKVEGRDTNPQAQVGLAEANEKLGRLEAAAEHYHKALAADPDAAEARTQLAAVHEQLGDYEAAEKEFRAAAFRRPDALESQLNLGGFLSRTQQSERSLEFHEKLRAQFPASTRPDIRVASILQRLGRFESARPVINRVLARDSGSIYAFELLAADQGLDIPVEDRESLERHLRDDDGLDTEERARGWFSLAQIIERTGGYPRAFECFQAGNALMARIQPYDKKDEEADAERILRCFDTAYFASRDGWGNANERPVFIVGMPRSGTSLVEQILASHPAVFGRGEQSDIPDMAAGISRARGGRFPDGIEDLSADTAGALAGRYLARCELAPETARRTTDKLPSNFRNLGFIATLLPGARIVHCRRDAMDTCASIYRMNFRGHHPYAHDLAALAHYHGLYDRLMAHWETVCPLRIINIQYEDLIADFEGVARELVAFCGIGWDDRCLRFHETDRPVETASDWQVRQPLFKTSLGGWRRYEKELRPLREAMEATGP